MAQFYILNRTSEVQVLAFGGSLGILQLNPYEARAVDERQLNTRVQEMINSTLKKVVICDEVPDKYRSLFELAQNPSLQSTTNTQVPIIENNNENDTNNESTKVSGNVEKDPILENNSPKKEVPKFTKTALNKMSTNEVIKLADELGITLEQNPVTKKDLIPLILKFQEG